MIFIIVTITIILFAVLLGYTWHSLDTLEKHIKVIYILIGLVVIAIITLIVFNISSIGIEYEETEIKSYIRTTLLVIFTPINGLFTMPAFAKILARINENDIEKKELLLRTGIILAIFAFVLIVECSYIKNTQLGIIEIYQRLK